VPKTPLGEAVQEDKRIDQARHDREPGTAGLTGDEPLPEVEDTANPENLAGNKEQEQGEGDQIEKIAIRNRDCGNSKDQQQNDRAPMNDDASVHQEKTAGPDDFGAT